MISIYIGFKIAPGLRHRVRKKSIEGQIRLAISWIKMSDWYVRVHCSILSSFICVQNFPKQFKWVKGKINKMLYTRSTHILTVNCMAPLTSPASSPTPFSSDFSPGTMEHCLGAFSTVTHSAQNTIPGFHMASSLISYHSDLPRHFKITHMLTLQPLYNIYHLFTISSNQKCKLLGERNCFVYVSFLTPKRVTRSVKYPINIC